MPNTPVAVSWKPWKIWFMPKFITEPMLFITSVGMPTARIGSSVCARGRMYFSPSCTSGLKRRLKNRHIPAAIHWPITVAMAAPATPMAGRPSQPWMKMGSRIMLITAPMDWLIMVYTVRPEDCSSRSPSI